MNIAVIDGQGGRLGQGPVEQMTAGRMTASDQNPAALLRDAIDNEKRIAGAP